MHGHAASALRARTLRHDRPTVPPSMFEQLEQRSLYAVDVTVVVSNTEWGRAILVAGTNKDDAITISQDKTGAIVIDDGSKTTRIRNNVKAVLVDGDVGDDRITFKKSVKVRALVDGGEGNDTITGGSGRDSIIGSEGNDWIAGGSGNDTIGGGEGDDSIFGNAGRDLLDGGEGDDVIVAIGGGAFDSVQGDDGFDSFWMDDSPGEIVGDDRLDRDELHSGAVHRVRGFADWVDTSGKHFTIGTELDGANLPDPTLAKDADGNPMGQKWRNFYAFPLFDKAGPMMEDVRQGQLNTCYFDATLAGFADVEPDRVRQSIVDLGDGTFGVRFYNGTGDAKYVRVDGDLPVNIDANGNTPPVYSGLGPTGAIWVAIMEKAYCYFRADGYITEQTPVAETSYHNIEFGYMDEVPNALNADDVFATEPGANPFANGREMLEYIKGELDSGRLVTYATRTKAFGELMKSHAYTVVGAEQHADGEWYLLLRNPWGTDGPTSSDGHNDGYITVHATDAFNSMMSVQSSWL